MKTTRRSFLAPLFLALGLVCALFILSGCQSTQAPEAVGAAESENAPSQLPLLSQMGNMTVSLYGVANFEISGTEYAHPTEFAIRELAISWMGPIFNAQARSGPGLNTIEQIHGSVSEDGLWVTDLSYSIAVNSVSYSRVTLRNVPLGNIQGKQSITFEQKGSETRKFVTGMTYVATPAYSAWEQTAPTFIAMDWENTNTGQVPILQITFAKGSGIQRGEGQLPGGMM